MPKTTHSQRVKLAIQLVVIVAFLTMAHGARAASITCTPNSSPPTATASEQAMTVSIQSIVVDGNKADSATSEHVELLRVGSSSPEATVTVVTKLMKGDKICTKDDDQVVLEISFEGNENDDLIFLDPNTEVEIGSICANQGRVLAWITRLAGVCHRFGTLARRGTEFEVENKPTGELNVVVYEGEVDFQPLATQANLDYANKTESKVGGGLVPEKTTIPAQTKITITATGPQQVEVLPTEELGNKVDRWSQQIVKTNQYKVPIEKGFVQNVDPETRAKTFVQARRAALVNKSEQGYLDMAQALNEWNNGEAAEKSLAKVKDAELRSTVQYMVNDVEAERLQGNLKVANDRADQTLNRYPDSAAANFLKGQILLESASNPGLPKIKANEQAKEYFSRALNEGSSKNFINTRVVEAQLDQTIKTQAIESLRKELWVSSGQRIFTTDTSNWVNYAGTTSLKVGSTQVSGKSVLSIYGDQFKLKVEDQVFTGRVVGNEHAGGISLAMDFDAVDVRIPNSPNVVISVTGSKLGDRIVLQSASTQTGSFEFKSSPVRIQ